VTRGLYCFTAILILFPWLLSCGAEAPSQPGVEPSRDARVAAMVLWQTARPVPEDAGKIMNDLSEILRSYGDAYPEIRELHIKPPWKENALLLWMTPAYVESVAAGLYPFWDDLNAAEGARVQRVSTFGPLAYVVLAFDDIVHPRLIAPLYEAFPGVLSAGPDRLAGDRPNIYPLLQGGLRTYLFRAASGDCLAGCYINEYWYFRVGPSGSLLLGVWKPSLGEPAPYWWAEAKTNRANMRNW